MHVYNQNVGSVFVKMNQLADCPNHVSNFTTLPYSMFGQTLSGLIKCFSDDVISAAMAFCQSCSEETKYRCLLCQKPTCNRSTNCSIAASEELPGWKAGVAVGICIPCEESRGVVGSKRKENVDLKRSTTMKQKSQASKPQAQKKRKCLSLQQRMEVVRYSKDNPGSGYRKIAEHFGIGRTQAQKIIQNKDAIIASYESSVSPVQQKRIRVGKYTNVNEALWDWYLMCRNSNIPISGPMLQEEALLIAEKLGIIGFSASNGWLESFKKQHGIWNMSVAGEEADVRTETVESWCERAREITRGWKPENIWNMDETGAFWRGLPEKTLSEKGKRCSGGKKAKHRNTWAFFVNAAGEKEDPIVIGKSAKPRCFKKLKDVKRPYKCHYFSNKKAWMNSEIMNSVLSKLNKRLIREKRNIILFMDNAPCHPPCLEGKFPNIKVVFLPKNTTSKTQPLDAGIIANWKIKYKKRLLRYVCSRADGSINASEIVKSIDVLMSIEWRRQAWDEVSNSTIKKCFQSTGMYPQDPVVEDDPFEGEELHDLQNLIERFDVQLTANEFIAAEDDIEVCSGLVDSSNPNWRNDLREELLHDDIEDELSILEDKELLAGEQDAEYDMESAQSSIKTVQEAMESGDELRKFAQFNGHQELSLAMSRVNDLLSQIKLSSPQQQTKIHDHFSAV